MAVWAPFALLLTTAALLVLPVAPALFELRQRRDASPLTTSRHDGRIANFAEHFRARMEPLRPEFEQCCRKGALRRISSHGMQVLLAGDDGFDFEAAWLKGIAAVMCNCASVPPYRMIEADLYAQRSLELGEGSAVRAGLSAGDIILGRNSTTLRWLHAYGDIYLREGSSALGRVSAGHSVRMEQGCGFQHVHAPEIICEGAANEDSFLTPRCRTTGASQVAVLHLNPHVRRVPANVGYVCVPCRPRLRVQGDFVLDAGETINANVIATKQVRFGPRSRLLGSAKSYGDMEIEEGASVHGSLVCGGRVRLGPRCFVEGPILAEGDVVLSPGCRIGDSTALTTICCNAVRLSAECQLHGTLWARMGGRVEG
jgi:hypothetical protein